MKVKQEGKDYLKFIFRRHLDVWTLENIYFSSFLGADSPVELADLIALWIP